MIELDRCDILEPVHNKRVQPGIIGRDHTPVHQRKGVVGQPGLEARDKAAGYNGQRHEGNNPDDPDRLHDSSLCLEGRRGKGPV